MTLPAEILAHLQGGGTLLVPTRRRAVAVRWAYASWCAGQGLAVWRSPDVLPWDAFLERLLQEARWRDPALPRRLSRAETAQLWRDATLEALGDSSMLRPNALAAMVERSAALADDYALRIEAYSGREVQLLREARSLFARRCQRLGALIPDWKHRLPYLQCTTPVFCAGFDVLPRRSAQWLEAVNGRLSAPVADPPQAAVQGYQEQTAELRAAIEACVQAVSSEAGARCLIVDPELARNRATWLRLLSDRLTPAEGPWYCLEDGAPLVSHLMARQMRQLWELLAGLGDFEAWSAWLRSPWQSLWPAAQARDLDLWLRERGRDAWRPELLRVMAGNLPPQLQATAAAITTWCDATQTLLTSPSPARRSQWATRMADYLAAIGWPAAVRGVEEAQVRDAIIGVVAELAANDDGDSVIDLPTALALLIQALDECVLEPVDGDAAITLTSSLDDPIVHYRIIRVVGLSTEVWPPAAAPDPLLPWELQRGVGLPAASADDQLRRARSAMRHWRARAGQCTFSWYQHQREWQLQPSRLLEELDAATMGAEVSMVVGPTRGGRSHSLGTAVVELETYSDNHAPPWQAGNQLPRGVRLLEAQANCPFRAFTELRLQPDMPATPQSGIDRRLRGILLHDVLAHLWRTWGNQRNLRAAGQGEVIANARARAMRALDDHLLRLGQNLPQLLREVEVSRLADLIRLLCSWELEREEFVVDAVEAGHKLALAGYQLRLQIDRLDRVGAAIAIIDYKSGSAKNDFDAHAERPAAPQLMAYALAVPDKVSAVALLHLTAGALNLRGIQSAQPLLPKLRSEPVEPGQWPALLQSWRQRLESLVLEFVAGVAGADPLPHACAYCPFPGVCRIGERMQK